ncbi:MAG: type IIA DNA topoisomerase subunit B [Oligosphaeraceae bacterium]|nr:type IIA DNA topoisomerase subunit B [Oligosphaeraceae bacterium]
MSEEKEFNFNALQEGEYDSSTIITLNPREHVRSRSGMYIGRLGNGEHHDDGIYVMLKEVVDNSVDEFVMGHGRKIEVEVLDEGRVRVRDYGRGIPLDKVVECASQINTGGKFITDKDGVKRPFSSSIGLNGVGLKVVNFLSERFKISSWRGGKGYTASYEEGELLSEEALEDEKQPNGTEVVFRPSREIFPDFRFDLKYVRRRMQHYAWLNSGLNLYCNGERFHSRRGLLDLLESKLESDSLYDMVHYKSEKMEFAFCHTGSFNENYYSFVNTQYTSDGGTHLAAFKEAIGKAINELAPKPIDFDDVRCGISGAIALKLQDPVFESQTKTKLGNTDIKADIINEVRQAIVDFLYKNPEVKNAIFEKAEKNESIRKQIQAVRRGARELAQKSQLKVDKLRDCKYHFNETDQKRKEEEKRKCQESMIFLTEGNSASGSVVTARDPLTQAVFSLRGKPRNCYGLRKETVYQNEELYGIMQAIGIENSMDDLRYGKIIIATDADVDGFHIRNLLITYFLTFFQPLVESERVFILETPLFRVRNKKKTRYCYNEEERDLAQKELGKEAEVTRFKGLGEISPEEFGQFIGEDMRLQAVTIDNVRQVDNMLRFFMGDNIPERRNYIMENLV